MKLCNRITGALRFGRKKGKARHARRCPSCRTLMVRTFSSMNGTSIFLTALQIMTSSALRSLRLHALFLRQMQSCNAMCVCQGQQKVNICKAIHSRTQQRKVRLMQVHPHFLSLLQHRFCNFAPKVWSHSTSESQHTTWCKCVQVAMEPGHKKVRLLHHCH